MVGVALFISKSGGLNFSRMNVPRPQKSFWRSRLKHAGCRWFWMWLMTSTLWAANGSFTNLLIQGAILEKRGDVPAALKIYAQAGTLSVSNSAYLCVLTKCFCDLMYATTSPEIQKTLAAQALACAQQAVKADANSATAHLCLAVGYAKNFLYADDRTKVNYSRGIKTEAEKAIALDPKQDVAYYMLGRWQHGVANMNFFYKSLVKIIYGGLPAASDDEAIANFKKAIALNPGRIIHHVELGNVYAATGQKKLAIVEWQKCRTLKPVDRDDADAQQTAAKSLARSIP
jgi:tetratricopeptide (TPR) repeat protein